MHVLYSSEKVKIFIIGSYAVWPSLEFLVNGRSTIYRIRGDNIKTVNILTYVSSFSVASGMLIAIYIKIISPYGMCVCVTLVGFHACERLKTL